MATLDSRSSRPRDRTVTGLESSGKTPASLASEAGVLAQLHALSDQKPGSISSLARLSEMAGWMRHAHAILPNQPGVPKATEWLMDNAYVVERAIRQVRDDLPPGYYRRLPALAMDDESCPPRVYALAHGIVAGTSLQLTAESISRFVSAYQEVELLDLAELWALPTMLRLTCIEVLVSAFERLYPDLPAPFEIARITNVPLRLDDTECVARSIRGLTALNSISWPKFIERTSAIDAVLEHDPAAAYAKMDNPTRDQYRQSVEDLARRSHHDERDVARRALTLARRAAGDTRSSHVGFWLVAEGRNRLEQSLLYRTSWGEVGPTRTSQIRDGRVSGRTLSADNRVRVDPGALPRPNWGHISDMGSCPGCILAARFNARSDITPLDDLETSPAYGAPQTRFQERNSRRVQDRHRDSEPPWQHQ